MSTKVEVRPIDVDKWHGKKGKESFTQPHTIQALADTDKMEYAVDLTEEDLKFLEERKIRYDLSLHYDPQNPHEFWDSGTAKVKMENRTMFFNKSVPLERIKIAIMRGSRFVANSKKNYQEGLYPDATHYIHDESEESEAKASKVELRNNATIEASKLTKERKLNIIKVLTGSSPKSNSDAFITVKINELIEKDAELFLRTLRRDKKDIAVLALVYEAIDKNVLRRDGHRIKHLDSTLGMDEDEAAEYLSKDENQEFFLIIKEKTKA